MRTEKRITWRSTAAGGSRTRMYKQITPAYLHTLLELSILLSLKTSDLLGLLRNTARHTGRYEEIVVTVEATSGTRLVTKVSRMLTVGAGSNATAGSRECPTNQGNQACHCQYGALCVFATFASETKPSAHGTARPQSSRAPCCPLLVRTRRWCGCDETIPYFTVQFTIGTYTTSSTEENPLKADDVVNPRCRQEWRTRIRALLGLPPDHRRRQTPRRGTRTDQQGPHFGHGGDRGEIIS